MLTKSQPEQLYKVQRQAAEQLAPQHYSKQAPASAESSTIRNHAAIAVQHALAGDYEGPSPNKQLATNVPDLANAQQASNCSASASAASAPSAGCSAAACKAEDWDLIQTCVRIAPQVTSKTAAEQNSVPGAAPEGLHQSMEALTSGMEQMTPATYSSRKKKQKHAAAAAAAAAAAPAEGNSLADRPVDVSQTDQMRDPSTAGDSPSSTHAASQEAPAAIAISSPPSAPSPASNRSPSKPSLVQHPCWDLGQPGQSAHSQGDDLALQSVASGDSETEEGIGPCIEPGGPLYTAAGDLSRSTAEEGQAIPPDVCLPTPGTQAQQSPEATAHPSSTSPVSTTCRSIPGALQAPHSHGARDQSLYGPSQSLEAHHAALLLAVPTCHTPTPEPMGSDTSMSVGDAQQNPGPGSTSSILSSFNMHFASTLVVHLNLVLLSDHSMTHTQLWLP